MATKTVKEIKAEMKAAQASDTESDDTEDEETEESEDEDEASARHAFGTCTPMSECPGHDEDS